MMLRKTSNCTDKCECEYSKHGAYRRFPIDFLFINRVVNNDRLSSDNWILIIVIINEPAAMPRRRYYLIIVAFTHIYTFIEARVTSRKAHSCDNVITRMYLYVYFGSLVVILPGPEIIEFSSQLRFMIVTSNFSRQPWPSYMEVRCKRSVKMLASRTRCVSNVRSNRKLLALWRSVAVL